MATLPKNYEERNELVRSIRSDQTLQNVVENLNKIVPYLEQNRQNHSEDDQEMRFCYASLMCEYALSCTEEQKRDFYLNISIEYLKECYTNKKNENNNNNTNPDSNNNNNHLSIKAELFVSKISQFLLEKTNGEQNQREQLYRDARLNEPTAILWRSIEYMTSFLNSKKNKETDMHNATFSMKEYLNSRGTTHEPYYFLPFVFAAHCLQNKKEWSDSIFEDNLAQIPGWEWSGNAVLATLCHFDDNLAQATTTLEQSLKNIDTKIKETTTTSTQTDLHQMRSGLQRKLIEWYKQAGRDALSNQKVSTLKRNEKSIEHFTKAINLEPQDLEVRYYLANISFTQSNWSTAFEHFHFLARSEEGRKIIEQQHQIPSYIFAWHRTYQTTPQEQQPDIYDNLKQTPTTFPMQRELSRLILKIHYAMGHNHNLANQTKRIEYFGYDPLILKKKEDFYSDHLLTEIKKDLEAISQPPKKKRFFNIFVR